MSFHLGKPRLPSVEYYPNNIGNLTIGTPRSYAFLVYGRDERGVQIQILNSLHKRGVRIISQNGYADEKNREFTLCISCDLGEVSVTPDDLVIELRRMKQVRNAMAICLKNRLFDGFLFPLTILMTNRVIAVDSNIFFLLQDKLENSEDPKSGLRDVGHDFALDVVRQIRERMSSGFPDDAIQENVRGYLKATGWGSFTWQSETSFERVTVVDPPIYSGKAVGNYFLHGIASGLLESFRKKKFSLAEEVYNQDTRSLTLMLSEKRIVEVKRLDSAEKKLPKTLEVKALEEVEKVIRSVELDEMEIETPPSPSPAPKDKTTEKPILVVAQSVGESRESAIAPVSQPIVPSSTTPPVSPPVLQLPAQQKREQLAIESEEEEEEKGEAEHRAKIEVTLKTLPETIQPVKPQVDEVEEVEQTQPSKDKKPVPKVIEIKKVRESEEDADEDDDFELNNLWFEEAVQEE